MNAANSAARALATATGVLGCAALFAMMVVAFFDVAARNLFNQPLPASSELIELAMVLTIFLLYPIVSFKGMHISIDLLDGFMPDRARRAQHVVAGLLGAAVFAAIAYRIRFLAADAWSTGEITGVLGIPLWFVHGFIAAMAVVTALAFLLTLPAAFAPGPFAHPSLPIDEAPE